MDDNEIYCDDPGCHVPGKKQKWQLYRFNHHSIYYPHFALIINGVFYDWTADGAEWKAVVGEAGWDLPFTQQELLDYFNEMIDHNKIRAYLSSHVTFLVETGLDFFKSVRDCLGFELDF